MNRTRLNATLAAITFTLTSAVALAGPGASPVWAGGTSSSPTCQAANSALGSELVIMSNPPVTGTVAAALGSINTGFGLNTLVARLPSDIAVTTNATVKAHYVNALAFFRKAKKVESTVVTTLSTATQNQALVQYKAGAAQIKAITATLMKICGSVSLTAAISYSWVNVVSADAIARSASNSLAVATNDLANSVKLAPGVIMLSGIDPTTNIAEFRVTVSPGYARVVCINEPTAVGGTANLVAC